MTDRCIRQFGQWQSVSSQYLSPKGKTSRLSTAITYKVKHKFQKEFWNDTPSHSFVDSKVTAHPWVVDDDYMDW